MKKKIVLGLVAVVIVVGGVAALSAFEAHIINVTATIENALSVSPDKIAFGTVFPQEKLYQNLSISLSESFLEEDRADDIDYVIKFKPKVREELDPYDEMGDTQVTYHEYCLRNYPEGPYNPQDEYWTYCYPSLCEKLSALADNDPENDEGVSTPHQAGATAFGHLAKSEGDMVDNWTIDLVVPCFEGMCDQTYDPAVYGPPMPAEMEHLEFGCDLWIEVTGTSRYIPLYEEQGDQTTELGPIRGQLTYDAQGAGALSGTVEVDEGYLNSDHDYVLVLNGPRAGSTADGFTNELLASKACSVNPVGHQSGWDGWWSNRQTDNIGTTDTDCNGLDDGDNSPLDREEGYYNFAFDVTAAQLEAGYDFSVALTPGVYSEVQFLVKDLDDPNWATVLEYPGVGETDSTPSTFSFTIE